VARLDRSLALRAALIQLLAVAVFAGVLAIALPRSFFEDWGGLSGPGSWFLCALITATALRLPVAATLLGAILAGLPSLLAVIFGLHWLGALFAIVLFAIWCGRLRPTLAPRRQQIAGDVDVVARRSGDDDPA
jgi:hypothetical protein